MDEDALEEVASELYALPPADFTAARDARVVQLRGQDREAAAVVKGWGRPTAAAWAVNALARAHADQLEPLLQIGEQMRGAQQDLDGPTLRALQGQVQQVLRGLLRTAKRAAADADVTLGAGPGEQVMATLRAAMADPGAADAVRSGRLVRALEHTGFGEVDVHEAVATTVTTAAPAAPATRSLRSVRSVRTSPARTSATRAGDDDGRVERERAEQERAERAERERAERDRRRAVLDEAVEAVAEAQEELHERAEEVEDAERRHEEAESAVADLTRRLEQARAELEEATGTRQHASRARDRAARAADRAAAAEQRAREAWEELRPLRVVSDR